MSLLIGATIATRKKEIVVGLLTGSDGLPVAVRVFEGNTVDTKTVAEQVRILAGNFGVKDVTLVGDRGMLKGPPNSGST